jgi:hypothetical protein
VAMHTTLAPFGMANNRSFPGASSSVTNGLGLHL